MCTQSFKACSGVVTADGNLRSVAAQKTALMQGFTILPMTPGLTAEEEQGHQTAGRQQPDVLLVRASFVGDLFLDACFIFAPVPEGHAASRRTQLQPPHQIPVTVPDQPAAERHSSGQAQGAGLQAAGPFRPTARRQRAEGPLVTLPASGGRHVKRQGRKEAVPMETEGRQDPPEPAPPETDAAEEPAPQLRNMDVRHSITNRSELQ